MICRSFHSSLRWITWIGIHFLLRPWFKTWPSSSFNYCADLIFCLYVFFFLSFFILQNVLGHWEWRTGQFPITPSQPHLRYVRVNVNKFHLISFREDTFFFYLSSFHFISCVMFFGPIILWNIQTLNSKLGSICFDTLKWSSLHIDISNHFQHKNIPNEDANAGPRFI